MQFKTIIIALIYAASFVSLAAFPARAQQVTTEQLSFDTNPAPGVKSVKLTAKLYMPQSSRPIAAMVIICSSGGIKDWNEGYYARELSKQGIAALVVDSFTPRGIHDIVTNQLAVTSWLMENDAFAALAELQKDKRIDPSRIGVMGISKGGIVAQNSAFLIRRVMRGTGVLEFALHVPIVPDCVGQFRDAKTTGKPIFYMLAELDDADPSQPCLDYVHRINVAGNLNATAVMYKGAHHNWEYTKPVVFMPDAINGSKCTSLIEDNQDRTFANGNVYVKERDVAAWMTNNCFTRGEHVGGGTDELKRQRTNDLLAFLKDNNFIAASSKSASGKDVAEPKPAVSTITAPAVVTSLPSQSSKVTESEKQSGFGPEAAQLIAAKGAELSLLMPPFGFGIIKGDVPSSCRRFVGAWLSNVGFEGGKGRQAMLIVTDVISGGTALGYVVLGPPSKLSSSQKPATYDSFAGKIVDGKLRLEAFKSPFSAEFSGQNKLILRSSTSINKRIEPSSIILSPVWRPDGGNSVAASKK